MKKAFFFLPVLVLAISCDKNDNKDNTSGTTKTQIITQSAWKFENAGVDFDKNGTAELDISNQIEACAKDNTYKFEANGSGTINEGAMMCSTSPGQTAPFTWAFISNETELKITSNAAQIINGQYKLVGLTDTRMTLSKDTTITGMGSATLIANFIH